MSGIADGLTCSADGCAPATAPGREAEVMHSAGSKLSIEVISDAICPWCWIAKRRLETALAALGPEITAEIAWRPFELNPDMPQAGLDRRAYRSRKFGSWERSHALDAQVAAAGESDGLYFRHDLMTRTPNTVYAHRLIWLAGREARQDAVVESLFSAYFREGRDVGDRGVLTEIGVGAGLDRAAVTEMYASDQGLSEVRAELERAATMDVASVPTVLVNGEPLFSGAIRPALMQAQLQNAVRHARV